MQFITTVTGYCENTLYAELHAVRQISPRKDISYKFGLNENHFRNKNYLRAENTASSLNNIPSKLI